MEKPRVLFVQQEITPYLKESHMGLIGRHLPQGIQEKGKEIRTFMPRFGNINERRNQLHEVIRLSGMNLVINDTDHPLIIKVASIQAARMQIYFIDNEDFFQRKYTLADKSGKYAPDNDERAIFFARGVIETVKKLGWAPDVVHCNGWFTSLMPLYLKVALKENPMFSDTKVVYSVYNDEFPGSLNPELYKKLQGKDIKAEHIAQYQDPTFVNISKAAIDYADGVIFGHQDIHPEVEQYARQSNKPLLDYQPMETYIEAFNDFYDEVLVNEPVVSE
ncbi:MAG: glycogen/starch synthase [Bacteroides sp.]|jgi:starch synthase|nr:glycogen/starch synthase [Bacteroides sp.]